PREGNIHEDLPMVIRNVFSTARRRIQKLLEKQRGETKTHPQQQVGAVVSKLFPEEGYGFLRTIDDQEIFFHRNSVLSDDFDRLEIGTGVRFTEEMGQKGLQASTVQIEDKPGSRISQTKGKK
ncbi:MAG: cold-shock protein, partial [Candidatus Aminicenantaceae bacterium]